MLIVDDDEGDGELAARRLAPLGAAIDFHLGPEGASDKIRDGGYDVVVLDVNMPGISGLQILGALKDHKSDARVMLYSAMDPSGLAEIAKTAGVAHLNKSASRKELVRAVGELLGGDARA